MPGCKVPSRMSGSEVRGCVELVVGAFTDAAAQVGSLCRKQKKRKGERDFHQLLLFQVLQQGAKSVQEVYDQGSSRLGSEYRIGDDDARERLLCVAIEINTEIMQPLASACNTVKPDIDLTKLHENAITARHDAIRTLGALRDRLDRVPRLPMSRFSPDSSLCGDDFLDETPSPPTPERSGLRRMLSPTITPTPAHRRVKSDAPASFHMSVSPMGPLVIPPRTADIVSPLSSPTSTIKQRPQSAIQPTRSAFDRLEAMQHPDMPNYAKPLRPKPKEARRDSVVSLPWSVAESNSSGSTIPSVPYDSIPPSPTRIPPSPTRAPPASPTRHAAVVPLTSPIYELPDAETEATTAARAYDAESIYSQPEAPHDSSNSSDNGDPGSPITDRSSTSRSSTSEAPTPTSAGSMRSAWPDAPNASKLIITGKMPGVGTVGETTTTVTSQGDAPKKKRFWHRHSKSLVPTTKHDDLDDVAKWKKELARQSLRPYGNAVGGGMRFG